MGGNRPNLIGKSCWVMCLLATLLLLVSSPRPALAALPSSLPGCPFGAPLEEAPRAPTEEEDEQEKERNEQPGGDTKATRHRRRLFALFDGARSVPCRLAVLGTLNAHSRTSPAHAATPFQRGA